MAITALRRIQMGIESTAGTRVAADKIMLGRMTWNPTLELYMPEDEERNSLALLHRRTITAQHTTLSWNSAANYEQVINWLAMGINGGVSATTPTNGVLTRDWTFTKSLTASNAQDTATFEVGDDQQEYEVGFGSVEQLEFTYAMGEPVMENHTLFANFPAKATFTGALTAPTIEDIVSQRTALYIDSTWAGLGSTQVSGILAAATVRIPTGLAMVNLADGSLEFGSVGEQKAGAEIEMTLLHTADGETQYDNYVSGGLIFIRLETTGSEIEQVTPTYDKLFRVDLAVQWTEPPQFFEDYNGFNAVVMSGRTFHDPTSGNELEVFVRNTETSY